MTDLDVILAHAGIHECMDSRLQPALDLIGGGNDGEGAGMTDICCHPREGGDPWIPESARITGVVRNRMMNAALSVATRLRTCAMSMFM